MYELFDFYFWLVLLQSVVRFSEPINQWWRTTWLIENISISVLEMEYNQIDNDVEWIVTRKPFYCAEGG